MKALLATLALLATTAVFASDRWVPYTDGRTGGCAVSNNGSLYGCTPQPPPPPEAPPPSRREPAPTRSTQDAMDDLMQSVRREPASRPAARDDYVPPTAAVRPQVAPVIEPYRPTAGQVAADNARANAKTYDLTKNLTVPLNECSKQGKQPVCDNTGCACK